MKNFPILVVLLSVLAFSILSCKSKQSPDPAANVVQQNDTTIKRQKVPENHYEELRKMALAVTPEVLKVSSPDDETKVFGVVMDWYIGGGIVTTTSFETGDASIYMNSGTMIIGGIGREKVSQAAKSFVKKAGEYRYIAEKTDKTPLPNKECVIFYLLTNKGIYSYQEKVARFDDKSSFWLPLFLEGNKLITEIRKVEESGKK